MSSTEVIDAPSTAVAPPVQRRSLIVTMAERYGVEANRMLDTLKATAFKSEKAISNEQMMALLIVANEFKLNPFTRELYAFPDSKNGIVPVVSVDGWARIINEHPAFDGMEFDLAADMGHCTCTIHRKDRGHPTRVTEYLAECKRNTAPWSTHPRRMLRHKAMIQAARLAFGFAGIYDPDEAARIVKAGGIEVLEQQPPPANVRGLIASIPDPDTGEVAPPVQQEPPPPPEQHDEPAPRGRSGRSLVAKYIDEIGHAADVESAELLLDEARSVVTSSQHAELVAVFKARWAPPE